MQKSLGYYEFSGKIGPLGVITVLLPGVVASIVLGFIYAYAIFFIPFVYINFFITVFFGAGIGAAVGWGARIGKVRNGAVIALAGLGFGLVGECFQWWKWVEIGVASASIKVTSAGQLIEVIQAIAENGAWSIFGFTPTGFLLYLIWFAEGTIIVLGAGLVAYGMFSSSPFCEKCKNWLKVAKKIEPLTALEDPETARIQLEQGHFDVLEALTRQSGSPVEFTRLELTHCPGCFNLFLISVRAIELTNDSDGDVVEDETDVVEHLLIDKATYGKLRKI